MSNFTQRMSVLELSFSGFLYCVLRLTTKAWLLQVGLSFPPLDPSLPGIDSVLTLQFGDFSQGSQGLVRWAFLRRCFSCFRCPLWLTTLGKRGKREEAVSGTPDIPKVFFSYFLFDWVTLFSLAFLGAWRRRVTAGRGLGDRSACSLSRAILSRVSGNDTTRNVRPSIPKSIPGSRCNLAQCFKLFRVEMEVKGFSFMNLKSLFVWSHQQWRQLRCPWEAALEAEPRWKAHWTQPRECP